MSVDVVVDSKDASYFEVMKPKFCERQMLWCKRQNRAKWRLPV